MAAQCSGIPWGIRAGEAQISLIQHISLFLDQLCKAKQLQGKKGVFSLGSVSACFFSGRSQFHFNAQQKQILKFLLFSKTLMFCRHSYTNPALIALQIHLYLLKNADGRVTPYGVLLNLYGLLGDIQGLILQISKL